MQVGEEEQEAAVARRLEDLRAALLPVPDVAHPGDEAAGGQLDDVADLVDVPVGVEAVVAEQIVRRAPHERALAAADVADQHQRPGIVDAEQLCQALPPACSRAAEREHLVGGEGGPVLAQLLQHLGHAPMATAAPPRRAALPGLRFEVREDAALALRQLVQKLLRVEVRGEGLEPVLAIGLQRLEPFVGQRAPAVSEEARRVLAQGRAGRQQHVTLTVGVVGDQARLTGGRDRLEDEREDAGAPPAAADLELHAQPLELHARASLEQLRHLRRLADELALQPVGDVPFGAPWMAGAGRATERTEAQGVEGVQPTFAPGVEREPDPHFFRSFVGSGSSSDPWKIVARSMPRWSMDISVRRASSSLFSAAQYWSRGTST